jgi:peptide/nickel transport system substrate-binding protein
VIAVGRAPESLASKPLREVGGAGKPRTAMRAFNAALVINDERELPRPYLAEARPQLNTDTWRLLPDGRMETTYRLRPNLTWHDGAPLAADDFVFAWRVYATPELGLAESVPLNQIEETLGPDARTVVIRWRQPFADADRLGAADLPPLPRHLLEPQFAQREADAFAALPFWSTDYVGLGPYRLTRIELGAFLEGEAFDGHALGHARISHIRLLFISDPNTVLANLLSDTVHVAIDDTFDLQQALVLEREWGPRNAGVVIRSPVGVRHSNIQLRPEFATPRALLDVRARRAIAYGTDRQALVDAVTDGLGTVADTLLLPQAETFAAVDRAVTKYPYNVVAVEQLMREVGFTRGPDGFYTSGPEGRFSLELAVAAGARNDTEVAVMADGLKRAGIDASIRVIPRAQITDRQMRTTLPGILTGSHDRAFLPPFQRLKASEIARPENRWQGSNHSGWVHPEFERLVQAYDATLDRSERDQHVVPMMKLVSDEVPLFALYYSLSFLAHASALRGPVLFASTDVAPWNLTEWEWTR